MASMEQQNQTFETARVHLDDFADVVVEEWVAVAAKAGVEHVEMEEATAAVVARRKAAAAVEAER